MTDASKRRPRVAIDGPAGAGKSTVARGLAERLGYVLLDTGAIYRTVALAVARAGIPWDDVEAVARMAERLVAEGKIELERAASPPEASAISLVPADWSRPPTGPPVGICPPPPGQPPPPPRGQPPPPG